MKFVKLRNTNKHVAPPTFGNFQMRQGLVRSADVMVVGTTNVAEAPARHDSLGVIHGLQSDSPAGSGRKAKGHSGGVQLLVAPTGPTVPVLYGCGVSSVQLRSGCLSCTQLPCRCRLALPSAPLAEKLTAGRWSDPPQLKRCLMYVLCGRVEAACCCDTGSQVEAHMCPACCLAWW